MSVYAIRKSTGFSLYLATLQVLNRILLLPQLFVVVVVVVAAVVAAAVVAAACSHPGCSKQHA